MTNILKLPRGNPEGESSPEVCLKEALAQGLTHVVIVGWDEKEEFYTNTNMVDGPGSLWLLRAAERRLWKQRDSVDD